METHDAGGAQQVGCVCDRACSSALRRSPKPGALMATTLTTPRSLFTTSVASASPDQAATHARFLGEGLFFQHCSSGSKEWLATSACIGADNELIGCHHKNTLVL